MKTNEIVICWILSMLRQCYISFVLQFHDFKFQLLKRINFNRKYAIELMYKYVI